MKHNNFRVAVQYIIAFSLLKLTFKIWNVTLFLNVFSLRLEEKLFFTSSSTQRKL